MYAGLLVSSYHATGMTGTAWVVPDAPLVTVIIPTRNEAANIEHCIEGVAAQTYPLRAIEVIVVDGASDDGTLEVAKMALKSYGFARAEAVSNPSRTTPSNLNTGLAMAEGEFVCRVDARSIVPATYVERCILVLSRHHEVKVVGGAQVAVPPRGDAVGVGIARALNNRLAMGLSRYRRGAASGPSDTVYLGAFRTSELRAAGGWDARFPTNQDFELNRRMSREGLVWFEAGLDVAYVPRDTIGELYSQYRRFGSWKVKYWRTTGDAPRPRQLAMLLAPPLVTAGGFALLVASPWRRRGALAGGALFGAFVLETAGSSGPRGGLRSRVVAVGALGAVAAGWLSAVVRELWR